MMLPKLRYKGRVLLASSCYSYRLKLYHIMFAVRKKTKKRNLESVSLVLHFI